MTLTPDTSCELEAQTLLEKAPQSFCCILGCLPGGLAAEAEGCNHLCAGLPQDTSSYTKCKPRHGLSGAEGAMIPSADICSAWNADELPEWGHAHLISSAFGDTKG